MPYQLENRSVTPSFSWLEIRTVDTLPGLQSFYIQCLLTNNYKFYVWLLPKKFKQVCLSAMQDVLWWHIDPWESSGFGQKSLSDVELFTLVGHPMVNYLS